MGGRSAQGWCAAPVHPPGHGACEPQDGLQHERPGGAQRQKYRDDRDGQGVTYNCMNTVDVRRGSSGVLVTRIVGLGRPVGGHEQRQRQPRGKQRGGTRFERKVYAAAGELREETKERQLATRASFNARPFP